MLMQYQFGYKYLVSKKRELLIKKIAVISGLLLVLQISFGSLFFIGLPFTQADNGNMCTVDVDVVFIMDRSGSMDNEIPTRLSQAQNAANSFISNLGTNDQSSLVYFSFFTAEEEWKAKLDKGLSSDHAATQAAIDGLTPDGPTNIGDAIDSAIQELVSIRANQQANKVAILLTDGRANKPSGNGRDENLADVAYAEAKAAEAANADIKIFTIGLGDDVNEAMLENIATISNGQYYFAPDGSDLESIYSDISSRVCQYGSISGCKYNDTDNDNDISGEEVIQGWEIVLSGGDNGPVSQLTDHDGCYTFAGLLAGSYAVTEGGKEGVTYAQTYPQSGSYIINLAEGEDAANKDFANYLPICGNDILDSNYGEVCEIGDNQSCTTGQGYDGMQNCSQDCSVWGECISQEECGDGIKNGNEECDGQDGVEEHYTCTPECILEYVPYCGDNEINQPSEECDNDEPRLCTTVQGYKGHTSCNQCIWTDCETNEYCGDNIVNGPEICDNGEDNSTYGYCNQDCTGPTPSVCGNGDKEGEEECDDGNNNNGDGCSAQCTLEQPEPYCGDGLVNQGSEECDGTDGVPEHYICTENCILEYVPYCGDGNIDEGEECDGQTGVPEHYVCNQNCNLEYIPYCGDNNIDEGEECDDGNTQDGDGCSAVCQTETSPEPEPYCGDGNIDQGEECDDGNTEDGDGCSAVCQTETGPEPEPYCGDGNIDQGEECDDGNLNNGDGCSDSCHKEANEQQSSSSGGGGGFIPLRIHNEQAISAAKDSVTITWFTNHAATSRVVYDTMSHPFMGDAPNYGYVYSTEEDTNRVTYHSVTITGLTANTTFYFRTISHGSPEIYSQELACIPGESGAGENGVGGGFIDEDLNNTGEPVVLGETGSPQLAMDKSVLAKFANIGDIIAYRVIVTNNGNLAAFNAILTDTLEQGLSFKEGGGLTKTWDLGNITPGEIKNITYYVNVDSQAKAKVYVNTATVTASNHDPISDKAQIEVKTIEILSGELAPTGTDGLEIFLVVVNIAFLCAFVVILRVKYARQFGPKQTMFYRPLTMNKAKYYRSRVIDKYPDTYKVRL